jgi:hypothetical protein
VSFILALLFATAFPSASRTSWMRPESFHLTIGMRRDAALATLKEFGWKPQTAKSGDVSVDYTDDKSFTLHFERDRLHAIRFELYTIVGQAHDAFDEERSFLHNTLGPPKKLAVPNIVLYDDRLPNVMVVLNDDPKSESGRKGVGVLVVRYYDPR